MTDPRWTPEITQVEAPAFEAIFRNELSYVWHTLRRLGVAERDLDDLGQEVFVTVGRLLPEYDPTRPLRPWLFGIAFRYAQRYREKAHRRLEELESSPGHAAPTPESPIEAELEQREAQRLVLDGLDRLTLAQRGVFVMAELDGYTAPEIAGALELPLNTVYSRLRTARQEFTTAVRRLARERTSP
jgi:RNA polymerase sigma-70 factor, ECF subfamily